MRKALPKASQPQVSEEDHGGHDKKDLGHANGSDGLYSPAAMAF